jgi:hypothetical protein
MGILSALLPAVLLLGSPGEPRTVNLFDGSREVFEGHWREKKLWRPLTRYQVVEDGDQAVVGLLVDSDDTGTEARGWFDDIVLRLDGATATASFSHDDWTSVVERYVDETGLVDYEGLAGDRAALDRYLDEVHRISPRSNPERFPTRNDALAYYLNAYNALVFEGVLSRGPESKSVWRGFISGHAFFVRMKITIGGEKTSLKKLEDKTIRKDFADPRIHAALNCASIGCPRLPRKAFDHRRLDEQLDAAMREFVADERHVRFDANARTVHLSKIFDWFKDDFLDHERANGHEKPRLIDYVNRYRAPGAAIPPDSRVRFLKYDKQINRQPPSRTAARAGERNATR